MALPPGFVDELAGALGRGFVITEPEQLATYDCDGLTGWRARPACVCCRARPRRSRRRSPLCARARAVRRPRRAHGALQGARCRWRTGSSSRSRMDTILEVDVKASAWSSSRASRTST